MSKDEETQMKDSIRFEKKTILPSETIPTKDIPSPRIFQVKSYRQGEYVIMFLDKKIWDEFQTLCIKKGLDPQKVIYGSIIRAKEILKEEANKQ